MDPSLLATLKQRLVNATDFSDVWTYFLDHFGEDPAFLALGERTRHDVVETLLVQTAKKLCRLDVPAANVLLTSLPEHQFIHGGIFAKGHMINVLYFGDIFMGTIMVCTLGSDQTHVLRFTGREVVDQTKPSMN
jgi:hypothetical protein